MRIVNPQRELLFADFNQDFSCLAIGTKRGFKIFNCDPFGKCFENVEGGIGIVEMLFCTNLVAIVGAGEQPAFSPRRLMIKNTKRQSTICELAFPTSVISVQMNRQRLVVILESSIYVYDLSNMKLLHTIDTAHNPHAVVSLSPDSKACYLAYPSTSPSPAISQSGSSSSTLPSTNQSVVSGDITIFDTLTLHAVTIIAAHKASLSAISFSANGILLATASNKGTVIRVFSVPEGAKLYQFRRGTYPARVHSLNFNLSVTMLACSSETETVHIFKLVSRTAVNNDSSQPNTPSGSEYDLHGDFDINPLPVNTYAGNETDTSGASAVLSSTPVASGIVGSLIGTATGTIGSLWNKRSSLNQYLPEFVSGIIEPHRDFAWMRVPGSLGDKSLVTFSSSSQHVFVVTNDGVLHQFALNVDKGGECILIKQHRLINDDPT